MTIRTALRQGTSLLSNAAVSEPRLTAEVLLGFAMHCERSYFYAHPEQELREVEWIHYGRYLHERMGGKPTQYITHRQEFFGREFRVTPAVLIPRPETELLVETVLRLLPDRGIIVDVGAGSGAIAVSLALAAPHHRVIATDISPEALAIAKHNAGAHHARVEFLQADLLAPIAVDAATAVVSNPPYIPLGDRLQREVQDWEPHLALFAGESGMTVYEQLIPQAFRVLRPGGLLALELGFSLAPHVRALVEHWRDIQILPDLAGIPRVLTAIRP